MLTNLNIGLWTLAAISFFFAVWSGPGLADWRDHMIQDIAITTHLLAVVAIMWRLSQELTLWTRMGVVAGGLLDVLVIVCVVVGLNDRRQRAAIQARHRLK